MINQLIDFPLLEDAMDQDQITAAVAAAGHPHLVEMGAQLHLLLRTHALLHLMGQEDTQAHTDCVEVLAAMGQASERGLKGVWN